MIKKFYLIGLLAYLYMAVLSILFYQERTIILDTAFVVFNIVKDATYNIQHFRFGNLFSQLLPVLARRCNMPLSFILKSYSISFVAYYLVCYALCGLYFKKYQFGLVVLLLNILFAADTFYWIPSEIPQGIALLMVVFAYLDKNRNSQPGIFNWAIIGFIIFSLVFFHPLLIVPFFFSIGYFLLNGEVFVNRKFYFRLIAVYILSLVLKITLFRTNYEAHSMGGLKNFITCFPNYFTLYSEKLFVHNCIHKYYWIPVIFVIVFGYYIGIRAWLKLVFFASAFLGYFFLVSICYPTSVTPDFYRENLYLPLSVFLALPILFEILPKFKDTKIVKLAFALILISAGLRFFTYHKEYRARLDWQKDFLTKYGGKKRIINSKNVDAHLLLMNWGTPYEFCLLSSLNNGPTESIIIDDKPEDRDWAGGETKRFLVNWNIYSYTELPSQYFRFQDTSKGYIVDRNN